MNLRMGLALLGVTASITTTGCMTFEVEGDEQLHPNSAHGREVVHGSLYSGTH